MVGTLVVAFRVIALDPDNSVLTVRLFLLVGLVSCIPPLFGARADQFWPSPGRTRAGARSAIAGQDAEPA